MFISKAFFIILIAFIRGYFCSTEIEVGRFLLQKDGKEFITSNRSGIYGYKIKKFNVDLYFLHYVNNVRVDGEVTGAIVHLLDAHGNKQACDLSAELGIYACDKIGSLIEITGDVTLTGYMAYGYDTFLDGYYGCFTIKKKPLNITTLTDCSRRCNKKKWFGINTEIGCVCLNSLENLNQSPLSSCILRCPDRKMTFCGGNKSYSLYSRSHYKTYVQPKDQEFDCLFDSVTKCSACTPGLSGFRCNVIDCNKNNGNCHGTCEPFKIGEHNGGICSCRIGYFLNDSNTCEDIDECLGPNKCKTRTTKCQNTVGSFHCGCKDGFKNYNEISKSCEDIDECLNPNACDKLAMICRNTRGSFACDCRAGYWKDSTDNCQDINECDMPNVCSAYPNTYCLNAPGTHSCDCLNGFGMLNDQISCVDIDECKHEGCQEETSTCVNLPGTYNCICNQGYGINSTLPIAIQCQDIDECNDVSDACPQYANCTNSIGSFSCQCLSGFVIDPTLLNVTCIDIDECLSQNCTAKNTDCRNFPGGFECACKSGYKKDHKSIRDNCQDIDECRLDTNPCDIFKGDCINTIGDYSCKCGKGFVPAQTKSCQDIDECQTPTICNKSTTICYNLLGNYKCGCKEGYIKKNVSILTDPNCYDTNECDQGMCDKAECANIEGSYLCFCSGGTIMRAYSEKIMECEDLNECENESVCDTDMSTCLNVPGSYVCACGTEYMQVDNLTCELGSESDLNESDFTTEIAESSEFPAQVFVLLTAGMVVLFIISVMVLVRMRISRMPQHSSPSESLAPPRLSF